MFPVFYQFPDIHHENTPEVSHHSDEISSSRPYTADQHELQAHPPETYGGNPIPEPALLCIQYSPEILRSWELSQNPPSLW